MADEEIILRDLNDTDLVEQMKDDSEKARAALARMPDAFPRLGAVPA